jgi:hypothetical protein
MLTALIWLFLFCSAVCTIGIIAAAVLCGLHGRSYATTEPGNRASRGDRPTISGSGDSLCRTFADNKRGSLRGASTYDRSGVDKNAVAQIDA